VGASASPCGISQLVHKPPLPLKAGPVSFKRLLDSRLKEPTLRTLDRELSLDGRLFTRFGELREVLEMVGE